METIPKLTLPAQQHPGSGRVVVGYGDDAYMLRRLAGVPNAESSSTSAVAWPKSHTSATTAADFDPIAEPRRFYSEFKERVAALETIGGAIFFITKLMIAATCALVCYIWLGQAFTEETRDAGTYVMRQGEAGDEFFIARCNSFFWCCCGFRCCC